jgi:uncharacterized protein YwqG
MIPPSIGRLSSLRICSITNSRLEAIPEELCRLPALEYLYLSGNQLTHLPDSWELPSLVSLNVANNQLATLPVSLVRSPRLKSLELNDNPWRHLDQEFLTVPELRLEYPEKARLFDFSYRGADGRGTVPWDKSAYTLASHSKLWSQFQELVQEKGHEQYLPAFQAIAKRTLFFELGEKDPGTSRGCVRFGGLPDLPQSLPYPTFHFNGEEYAFEFLAQLDCAALASFQDYLPRTGFLYFFINDQESFTPRVLYFDGDRSELIPADGLPTSLRFLDNYSNLPSTPYRAFVKESWSLPSDYASHCNQHYFQGEAAVFGAEDDLLSAITEDVTLFEPQRHHEVNGYVFTQHESPELQAALEKRGNPEDWTVLLKLASIGDFCWWDAGDLFFVIHKSDLAKKDFSNVYCGLESS